MVKAPVDVNSESSDAVTEVATTVLGVVAPRVPLTAAEVSVSDATEVVVEPKVSVVAPNVRVLFASKLFGTVAEFSATTFEPTTYTFLSDGCVTNTSFEPAVNDTNEPALLEDSTVSRDNVFPEEV
jgi:hypothetical protein